MKVGYVRVSTKEQNPARQLKLMEEWNVDKVYLDKMSGKNLNRPQFTEMMEFVREGDTVYVESFSRLSRSTADLLNTVNTLKEKGVSLVSDKEKIDTTTPAGVLVMTVFGAIYQFERESTRQRQREGIEIAKKKGKYKGRLPYKITNDLLKIMADWQTGRITLSEAIKQSRMSKSTFLRKCKEVGVRKSA